jgi:hypothetical protein
VRDVLRRYWPLHVVTAGFLVVTVLFARYLEARQQIADDRAERYRKSTCAILTIIRGSVPQEIRDARRAFARKGHPDECMPAKRKPAPSRGAPSPTPSPAAAPTVVVFPDSDEASPTPTVTVTRTATARPTPSSRPSMSPSASPTCAAVLCLR